jgi:acetyltransferase-like isoleucine patch superfamily enzyme
MAKRGHLKYVIARWRQYSRNKRKMRFTVPALNNDYFDEDYLRVFGFPKMGKNVKVHRSVVFKVPAHVRIGDNVTIGPFCVFDEGRIVIGNDVTIKSGCYFEGRISIPPDEPEPGEKTTLAPNGVWIGDPVTKKKKTVEVEEDEDDDSGEA